MRKKGNYIEEKNLINIGAKKMANKETNEENNKRTQKKNEFSEDPSVYNRWDHLQKIILLKYVMFNHLAPPEKKREILGNFLKLQQVLYPNPQDLSSYTISMSISPLPNQITQTRQDREIHFTSHHILNTTKFLSEYLYLSNLAMEKNPQIYGEILKIFLIEIWNSPHLDEDPSIQECSRFFDIDEFRTVLKKSVENVKEINSYLKIASNQKFPPNHLEDSFTESILLDWNVFWKKINGKLESQENYPSQLKESANSILSQIKHLYEGFRPIFGYYQAICDLAEGVLSNDYHSYFKPKNNHIWYGLFDFGTTKSGLPKKRKKSGSYPLIDYFSKGFTESIHFFKNIFYDFIRVIRNIESHDFGNIRQEKLGQRKILLTNKKEHFSEEFSLNELREIRNSLYLVYKTLFAYPFYRVNNEVQSYLINNVCDLQKPCNIIVDTIYSDKNLIDLNPKLNL